MSIDKVKLLTQICHELDREIGMPAIGLIPDKDKKLTLTGSKLGGVPYWDNKLPYPTDKDGNKLMLLAQINFGEIAENWPTGMWILPDKGILQFFLLSGDDYLFGMDFDNYANNNNYRVIYHPEIDPTVTEKDVLALDIPTSLSLKNDYEPIKGEVAFDFKSYLMAHPDFGNYKEAFMEKAAKYGLEIDQEYADPSYDLYDCLGDELGDKLLELTYYDGSCVLGYPTFTQSNIFAEESQYSKYNLQLLQLASINDGNATAMWGDVGIAHFFINADNLISRDFSDTMYYWDC